MPKLKLEETNNRLKNNREGFTLVELLMVVAIVVILFALLFTGVSNAKAKARQIQCVNNVRQLGQALQLFVAEFHTYPLHINGGYWKGKDTEHFTSWNAVLENQLSKNFPRKDWADPKGVWDCPAAEKPSDWRTNLGYTEYGYNAGGLSSNSATNLLGLGGHRLIAEDYGPPTKEAEVTVPAEMIALGDGLHGGKGVVQDGYGLWRVSDPQDDPTATRRSIKRHHGKANISFCDGHVESLTLKFLFEDTGDEALVRWNRDHEPHRELLR
jgi:prepilin-type processing-associated H-X9-DG protein/prepilin-type N-terminal cleavage/methylation domain-containing protein